MAGGVEQRRSGRFIAGDPLRAVAALSVVTYHTAYAVATAHHSSFESAFGQSAGHVLAGLHLGLYVFFVLSGYLISRPFVLAFIKGEPLPMIRRYVRNRLLRIVPAFWIIFTILLLWHGTYGASPGDIAAVYGFAQNYSWTTVADLVGPAWTLDIEIVFYMLVPLVAMILVSTCAGRLDRPGRQRLLFWILGVIAFLSLALRAVSPGTLAWQTSLPAMVFAFVPGVALAAIETTDLPCRLRARGTSRHAALLVAGALLPLAWYMARFGQIFPQYVDAFGGLLAAVGCGAVVAGLLTLQWSTDRSWRLLDNTVMQWIGERSYSLYLIHTAVGLELISRLTPVAASPRVQFLLILPPMLLMCLIVSAVSYRLFEQPFLALRASSRSAVPDPDRLVQPFVATGASSGGS
jgi:peptidoglycan/LPS O-acetylase OafA/YrhL